MQGIAPIVAQQVKNLTLSLQGCGFNPSLASLSGLRIQCCWTVTGHTDAARIQCYHGCGIGLSCSSDSTLYLGTSICCRCGHKKKKKKKKDGVQAITFPLLEKPYVDLNWKCVPAGK